MGKQHRLAERRQQIVAAVEEAGQLSVDDLSARFDVSAVTIRQDLQALSEQGLLLRTRGRALATTVMPEYSFDIRQQQQAAQKVRIGQAAARMVENGDTIIIDASTTAQAIIPYIKSFSELTVITNSLKAAMSLLDAPQIQVIMPGTHLRHVSLSLIGDVENSVLERMNVRLGFFGARGITVESGLTDVNVQEVAMKRLMVERCQQVIGVIDSRKWGRAAAITFAHLNQVSTLITDNNAHPALIQQVRQRGVEVVII
ncbi:MAG: DeoR/GlpR transcriptional regulator [Anaerolineae bacterium]|nr:DeoR/GlpR transcriptional regulator [Anaerolineae bacterium]